MGRHGTIATQPVHVRLTSLFEARWSYADFVKVMPFGPDSEGQAFAYGPVCRVEGERLSGSYRIVQYPRWRADGLYLPDVHGMIKTDSGEQVAVRGAGYGIPVSGAEGQLTISHWMRFWSDSPALDWLNWTVAFGIGSFVDDEARVNYFAAVPVAEAGNAPPDMPSLELLGTAQWEYPEDEFVRTFGDDEGVGFATSTGSVEGGLLAGRWRGWHYPTHLRNGLHQLDAHAEISTPGGRILSRHGGLETAPSQPSVDLMRDVVQHATFLTESTTLAKLNRTLAIGVGFVRSHRVVKISYYGLSGPA